MKQKKKVISCMRFYLEKVEFEGDDNIYYRSSGGNWEVVMGESTEPVYDNYGGKELEEAYQEFKHRHDRGI